MKWKNLFMGITVKHYHRIFTSDIRSKQPQTKLFKEEPTTNLFETWINKSLDGDVNCSPPTLQIWCCNRSAWGGSAGFAKSVTLKIVITRLEINQGLRTSLEFYASLAINSNPTYSLVYKYKLLGQVSIQCFIYSTIVVRFLPWGR